MYWLFDQLLISSSVGSYKVWKNSLSCAFNEIINLMHWFANKCYYLVDIINLLNVHLLMFYSTHM